MKTRMFDGKVYIKASELARDYRYTSDYIGQLARSQKIEAKLAGKTWYVHEASLTAYIKRGYVAKPAKKASTMRKPQAQKPARVPSPAVVEPEVATKPKMKAKKVTKPRAVKKPVESITAESTSTQPPSSPAPTTVSTGIWQKAASWFGRKLGKDKS